MVGSASLSSPSRPVAVPGGVESRGPAHVNFLSTILQDDSAPGAIGLVIALSVASVAALIRRQRTVAHALSELRDSLPQQLARWNGHGSAPSMTPLGLWSAIEETFLFRAEENAADGSTRIVVRADPLPALRNRARKEARGGAEGVVIRLVGENLTAIGLILTFTLLGIVLVGPIFNALGAKETANAELQEAIRKMGAKFFVSAVALLGAVLFQFTARLMTQRTDDQVASAFAGFSQSFEELSTFQARMAQQAAVGVGAMKQVVEGAAGAVNAAAGRLENLKVTLAGVDDLLVARLRAAQLRELSEMVAKAVEPPTIRLENGLGKVRSAIENQAQSNLEAVVGKLQDALSGGFQSQSNAMAQQLAEFAQLLPQLQAQFSALTGALGRNAEQLGEQNGKALESLTARIGELLARFDSVSAGMNDSVAQLAKASRDAAARVGDSAQGHVAGLAEALSRSAQKWSEQNEQSMAVLSHRMEALLARFDGAGASMEGAVEKVALASQQKAQALIAAGAEQAKAMESLVQGLRSASAADVESFEKRSTAFAELMGKAQLSIAQVATGVNEATARLESVLEKAGAVQTTSQQAGSQFLDAARQVSEGARRIEGTLEKQTRFVDREEQLLSAQRAAAESLEKVLSGMLRNYEQAIAAQAKLLGDGWKALATDTEKIVSRTSDGLVDAVDELTQTVKDLQIALQSTGAKP